MSVFNSKSFVNYFIAYYNPKKTKITILEETKEMKE